MGTTNARPCANTVPVDDSSVAWNVTCFAVGDTTYMKWSMYQPERPFLTFGSDGLGRRCRGLRARPTGPCSMRGAGRGLVTLLIRARGRVPGGRVHGRATYRFIAAAAAAAAARGRTGGQHQCRRRKPDPDVHDR